MAVTPDRKPAATRTTSDSKVHLLHADRLYFDERLHRTAQILVGNVQFSHEGAFMYCDSALFYESTNSFDAFGNKIIYSLRCSVCRINCSISSSFYSVFNGIRNIFRNGVRCVVYFVQFVVHVIHLS